MSDVGLVDSADLWDMSNLNRFFLQIISFHFLLLVKFAKDKEEKPDFSGFKLSYH